MLETTQEYKNMIERPIRNRCHLKVSFGNIDPLAAENSTITDNGHTNYSDSNAIDDRTSTIIGDKLYATLEHNFWKLNENYIVSTGNSSLDTIYQGYVSNLLSDDDGNFVSSKPTLTFTFNTPVKFKALTFNFDVINNTFPTDVDIKSYLNGNLVDTTNMQPNNSNYVFSHSFPYLTSLTMTFNSTNKANRRIRLFNILYGAIFVYDTSQKDNLVNLVRAEETKKVSLVSSTLPTLDFSFEINNTFNTFNPEEIGGAMEYLVEKQPISYEWGIENDDDSINWITGGNLVTKSSPTISQNTLKVECTDRLSMLDEEYNRGMYYSSGITLYNLAKNVLDFANLGEDEYGNPMYILDDSLKNIRTNAPLPSESIKTCLQIIANAGRCILYTNRDGKIVIKPLSNNVEDVYLDLNNFLEEYPKTELIPLMKSAQTEYSTFNVSASSEELSSTELVLNGTQDIVVTYDDAVEISATINGGTLNSASYYTHAAILNVTGTGATATIKINGKKLEVNKVEISVNKNSVGDIAKSVNPLICSNEDALAYIDYFGNIIEYRNKYTSKFVGRPELDVGDRVLTQTRNNDEMNSVITELKIGYEGSFNGSITFIKEDV